jgi:hypothetical protein
MKSQEPKYFDWYVVQMDEVGINNFIENKLKIKLQLHLKAGI